MVHGYPLPNTVCYAFCRARKCITARGHFEKSQEGVKEYGYLGSNSGVILINRDSRDIDNIKILVLIAKRDANGLRADR